VGRPHLELPRDSARIELVERVLHPLTVGLGPDENADTRAVHVGDGQWFIE
jgi:hypothetical protein